tara:strand:- start:372 stop:713 length:342 start_codon:yes stop_codon:yes gene_type:complete
MDTTTEQQLEQALSFAQYQSTLNQQRRLLREQFESDTTLAYNGGLFKVTQEWIGSIDLEAKWVLDMNGNPINIDDAADLKSMATTAYREALTKYGEEYQKLRRQRSVRSLTDL